jgi:hypothetical protein
MLAGRRSGRFPAECAAARKSSQLPGPKRDAGHSIAPCHKAQSDSRAGHRLRADRRPAPGSPRIIRTSLEPCGDRHGSRPETATARDRSPTGRGVGAVAHHWSHAGTVTAHGRRPPRRRARGHRGRRRAETGPRRVPPADVSRATRAAFLSAMESAMIADRSTDHPRAPAWRRPPRRDRGAPVRQSPMVGFGIVIAPSTGP